MDKTTTPVRVLPRDAEPPPAPPGVRYVRAPFVGIVVADDDLRKRVNRLFHWPMIVLALLVLPLLFLRLYFNDSGGIRYREIIIVASDVALSVIWLAFVVEFVTKIAIAEHRVEYVKRNWLDLVIILLPMLRPLRVTSLARTSRLFTLRGVGMKFARYVITAVVGLEATERLLHRVGLKSRVDRKKPEEMTRHELMRAVKKLRKLSDAWDEWHEAHQDYLQARGIDPFDEVKPAVDDDADDSHPAEPADADAKDASSPLEFRQTGA